MKYLSIHSISIALLLFINAHIAQASWITSIDEFNIDQNSASVVSEDFSSDLASPFNINFPLSTDNGRGLIDSQSAGYGTSRISGRERWFQRARSNQWLHSNDTFLVSSVFDIVKPDAPGRYGIRLTDQCGSCTNNDLVDIGLRFSALGNVDVAYRYNNDVRSVALADGFDFAQSTGPIDVSPYSQVSLFLKNDGDGLIDAGFLLLDNIGSFDLASMYDDINWFSTGYHIFNNENRVRAEFYNTEIVRQVPEPPTIALLMTALLGITFLRRRKTRA